MYGNRGCLHDDSGRIRRRFAGRRWIACRLRFRDWRRTPLLQPGRFTELFFLDEATALAAGHRPCALCRRADYVRFQSAWREHHTGPASAAAIDTLLHHERVDARGQRHHAAPLEALPDGAFVRCEGAPWLVLGAELLRWSPAGYALRRPRPAHRRARVITPPSLIAVLQSGWSPLVPLLHPSARAGSG